MISRNYAAILLVGTLACSLGRADEPLPMRLQLVAEFQGHEREVEYVCFSKDGKSLITSSIDGTVRFWATPKLEPTRPARVVASKDDGNMVRCAPIGTAPFISVLSDGCTLVIGDQFEGVNKLRLLRGEVYIRYWDIHTRKEISGGLDRQPIKLKAWLSALSPNGKSLLILKDGQAPKYEFEIIDRIDGKRDVALEGSAVWPNPPAFSMDGNSLAVPSEKANEIKVWDVKSRKVRLTLSPSAKQSRDGLLRAGAPARVAFSPDSKLLAAACGNETIQIWDAQTGRPVRVLGCGQADQEVSFSGDGRFLASAGGASVYAWDTTTYRLVARARAPGKVVRLAFSTDSKFVALSLMPSSVQLWLLTKVD